MMQRMGTECGVVKQIIDTALAAAPSVSKYYVVEQIRTEVSPALLLNHALKVTGNEDIDENGERIVRNGLSNMALGPSSFSLMPCESCAVTSSWARTE